MIKVVTSANSTITVTDNGTNGVGLVIITLGANCEVKVFDEINPNNSSLRQRTCIISNKFNGKPIASVSSTTLDPSSTSYSSNMDTYATNLIAILYA